MSDLLHEDEEDLRLSKKLKALARAAFDLPPGFKPMRPFTFNRDDLGNHLLLSSANVAELTREQAKEWEAALPRIHHLAYGVQRTTGQAPTDLWLGNREWACLRAWMDLSGMIKINSAPPNHFLFESLTVRRVLEESCLRVGFSVASDAC